MGGKHQWGVIWVITPPLVGISNNPKYHWILGAIRIVWIDSLLTSRGGMGNFRVALMVFVKGILPPPPQQAFLLASMRLTRRGHRSF
jgi:hypothetical protein